MEDKIGNEKYINETLRKNNLHAKKKFGQNFLTNERILDSIIDLSEVDKDTLVIEVGPGLGSLTERILKRAGFLVSYEIDPDLIPILNDNFKDYDNFKLINEDILSIDINEDIKKYQGNLSKVYMVSNLPYYITTPIIIGMLEKTDKIKRYVMMMQKEVALRLTGKPNTKDYAEISVAIKYRGDSKIILNVPRTAFIPSPNVDSSVIAIDLYENKRYFPKDEKLFFEITRIAFNQRRKTLLNNLSTKYKKEVILKMIKDLGYKDAIRAEELTIDDFIKISDYMGDNNA